MLGRHLPFLRAATGTRALQLPVCTVQGEQLLVLERPRGPGCVTCVRCRVCAVRGDGDRAPAFCSSHGLRN